MTSQNSQSFASPATGRGAIIAIGGAEDKFKEKVILTTFSQLAGGPDASIAILPTASSIESAGERYKALFLELGVRAADVLLITDRDDANAPALLDVVQRATGIFITGGNQLKLSSILGGTRLAHLIRERNTAGAVVAGTSAGASILSSHMVAFGISGESPRQRMANMAAGFGLAQEIIIDQHFRQRDRIGRLLAMVAANPGLLGCGIDEDTAALIDANNQLHVLGRHSVTIVDGARMTSDIHQVRAHGGISVANATLHVLTAGRQFDLTTRTAVIANVEGTP